MPTPRESSSRAGWTKNRAASYLSIPPLPPPAATRPVTFCVPDHPDWRAALYGAISLMSSWLAWERDEAHSGKIVAQYWSKIILEAQLAAERGEPSECMNWCAIIADCIANSEGTKQAIRDLVASDPAMITIIENIIREAAEEGRLPIETRTSNLINPVECSPGSVFKRISTLLTTLHFLTLDLFQLLRQASVPFERAEKIISAIPVIGILPFDEIIGLANAIINTVSISYEAAYSDVVYDEMRCELFCLFGDGCGFSLEEITAWYGDKIATLPEIQKPEEFVKTVLAYVATGNPGNRVAIYAMHVLALALIRSGEKIMGADFSSLVLRIEADANEIDDDYLQLCETCAPGAITLTAFGYGGNAFGIVPATAQLSVPFAATATPGHPSVAGDHVLCFYFDDIYRVEIDSHTWSHCPLDGSEASYGWCPENLDPTVFSNWVFMRGPQVLPEIFPANCRGVWFESVCGNAFTITMRLEPRIIP